MNGVDLSTADAPKRGREQPTVPNIADWLIYCGIVVCSVLKALIGNIGNNADTVAYLDLSDAIKDHRWHALVNAYWFPVYPALIAVGRAIFGFRARYELLAARLVSLLACLFFVGACIAFAASVRRLMLQRGIQENELIPARILYLWVAGLSYFFALHDFALLTPDGLISAFMMLAAASLIWTRAGESFIAFGSVGLFAAFAFLTKSFAFPFFVVLILFSAGADLRRFHKTSRLAISALIFALIAGPYVAGISVAKGRLTIGDSGRLNLLWQNSHAEVYNPVADPTVFSTGKAKGSFKHPGELLAKSPRTAYFGRDVVYGSTPQWDDPSYWWDGMAPSFGVRDVLASINSNLTILFADLVMRVQAAMFLVAVFAFGFSSQRRSFADPVLPVMLLVALACIGLYAIVLIEPRYIAFCLVMIAVLYVASALTRHTNKLHRSLHLAVLMMSGLVLIYEIQNSLQEWKHGTHTLGLTNEVPVLSAGSQLAAHFAPGTEIACMGHAACLDDPYWARYAGVKMTAVIEGYGSNEGSADVNCKELQQNLSALDRLRERHVRAIVAKFDGVPCSSEWIPLGKASGLFYRPL